MDDLACEVGQTATTHGTYRSVTSVPSLGVQVGVAHEMSMHASVTTAWMLQLTEDVAEVSLSAKSGPASAECRLPDHPETNEP